MPPDAKPSEGFFLTGVNVNGTEQPMKVDESVDPLI